MATSGAGSIAAGQLRRPVQIVERQDVPDGRGGSTETWMPIQDIPTRADIEGASGSIVTRFVAIDSTVNSGITIRWRRGISPSMRVHETLYDVNGNATGIREFVIIYVEDPDNTHRVLQLACTELQAAGTT